MSCVVNKALEYGYGTKRLGTSRRFDMNPSWATLLTAMLSGVVAAVVRVSMVAKHPSQVSSCAWLTAARKARTIARVNCMVPSTILE